MNQMERNNALEFIVKKNVNKNQIKKSIEKMFDVKVKSVNTRITKNGKHAIVIFMPEFKAEDIGMRIGVF
jgi:large subunit ribosomal protein L23